TVEDPLIVDLEANGFYPGDKIMISYKESVHDPNNIWWWFYLYGLFSSSKDLKTQNFEYTPSSGNKKWPMVGPLNRVPGAIDAALGGYVHQPIDDTNIWKQGRQVENDIPEDFNIGGYLGTNKPYNPDGSYWDVDSWGFQNGFWITIPPGAKYLFFQLTSFWMLSESGYCTVTIDKDTDGDALPDSWEKNGIDFNKDGTTDLTLPDADFMKKDIYIEVDYMDGHRPDLDALDDVVAAFQSCPSTVKNGPINIHIEVDDSEPILIVHEDVIRAWDRFDKIKEDYFGTLTQKVGNNAEFTLQAKTYIYHYCLFVHGIETWNGTHWRTGAAGYGEAYGNDFIVSLGIGFDGETGSRDQQAATFMHELGHNLGLEHGGIDKTNYKPNYLSIMNYLFIFDGDPLHLRPLTYSSAKLASLNEAKLDESEGVKGANWDWTVHSGRAQTTSGTIYVPLAVPTSFGIDWNNNGEENETNVVANVNNYPQYSHVSADSEVLEGYDDWSNLRFYFQQSKNIAKGVHVSASGKEEIVEEINWEIVQAMEEDGDNMIGGPTGPVQIIDVPPQDLTDESTGNGLDLNPIVGLVVAIVPILLIILLFTRKKKKRK
ncbi:MAG: hypothetical protein ACFFC7_34110, partial [Candidatus Hermodarchaeota archaeon]